MWALTCQQDKTMAQWQKNMMKQIICLLGTSKESKNKHYSDAVDAYKEFLKNY